MDDDPKVGVVWRDSYSVSVNSTDTEDDLTASWWGGKPHNEIPYPIVVGDISISREDAIGLANALLHMVAQLEDMKT